MVPVHLPTGAAILCCGKLAASELHCLTAAPRLAIHEALATPHKYLGTPYELGLSSKMDDACIAYQLFLEVSRFLLAFLERKEKKRKDYAFWRQFNEKPSIILSCWPFCRLSSLLSP